jgi:hypothetical protein
MQCEYFWNLTGVDTTGATIFQDIIDILTGETDVNNLSADCNKTTTWIEVGLHASPWVVHDPIAGTGLQILKTTQTDSGETKFLGIYAPTPDSSPKIQFAVMSAWNEVAHTGTDYHLITGSHCTTGFYANNSTFGSLQLFASRECMLFSQSRRNGRWGNDAAGNSADYGTVIVGEHTRGISTQIGDQPNWFVAPLGGAGGAGGTGDGRTNGYKWSGRRISTTNTVEIQKPYVVNAGLYTACGEDSFGNFNNNYPEALGASQARKQIGSVQPQSEAEAIQYKPEMIFCGGHPFPNLTDASTIQGNVSTLCDIWKIPQGSMAVNAGNFMNWNGKRYMVWRSGDGGDVSTITGHRVLVPYG